MSFTAVRRVEPVPSSSLSSSPPLSTASASSSAARSPDEFKEIKRPRPTFLSGPRPCCVGATVFHMEQTTFFHYVFGRGQLKTCGVSSFEFFKSTTPCKGLNIRIPGGGQKAKKMNPYPHARRAKCATIRTSTHLPLAEAKKQRFCRLYSERHIFVIKIPNHRFL